MQTINGAAAPAPTPYVSGPCHYRDSNGQDFAAVIVKVIDAEAGLVNLHVFAPDHMTDVGDGAGRDAIRASVSYGACDDGALPLNAWHW